MEVVRTLGFELTSNNKYLTESLCTTHVIGLCSMV